MLRESLTTSSGLDEALQRYEHLRAARFDLVRKHAANVENAASPADYAEHYAAFSHWMLTTAPHS